MKKTLAFLAVALATLAVALATLAVLSACRSPLGEGSLTTTVTITVAGVLPPSRSVASDSWSRVLVPSTVEARVTASWGGGSSFTQTVPVSGGQATVRRLPLGVAIELYFEALDAAGNVLTVGTISIEPLSAGSNPPQTVTLAPSAAVEVVDVGTFGSADLGTNYFEPIALASGSVVYYRFTVDPTDSLDGEYQVLFDTGRAQWAWLKLYDANWKELPAVCSDAGQGWIVADLSPGQVVQVAVSNVVSSPGYPAGSVSGALQVRPACFAKPDAIGGESGTSSEPGHITEQLNEGASLFLRSGIYLLGAPLTVESNTYVYGGFASTNWNDRSGVTTIDGATSSSSSAYTVGIYALDRALLDGLTVYAFRYNSETTTSSAVSLETSTGTLVMNDCRLYGNTTDEESSGNAYSYAAYLTNGVAELASCSLHGGKAASSGLGDVRTAALYIYFADNTKTIYVHGCDLDGGYITTSLQQTVSSYGIYCDGYLDQGLVVAGCRIWGGTVLGGLYGSVSQAAIYFNGLDDTLTNIKHIANSVLCAGYLETSMGSAYAIYNPHPDTVISGCVLDGGMGAVSGASYQRIGLYVSDSYSPYYLASTIMLNSGTCAGVNSAIYDTVGATASSMVGQDVVAVGVGSWYENTVQDFPSIIGYSLNLSAVAPASYFSIFPAGPSGTEDDFELWLQGSWRIASAYASTAAGVKHPYDLGGITPAMVSTYPALGLDLAGKPRPTTGPWKRGAYE